MLLPVPSGRARDRRDMDCYVALMGNLLDSEPATFDASKHQCWRDAMTEEYESILRMMFGILYRDQKGNPLLHLNGFTRSSMQQKEVWRNTRRDLQLVVSLRKKE